MTKFQIIGHGNKKDYVKDFLNKHNIKNVIMHDFLVGDELNKALNRSSCFIVSLEKGLRGLCAPSKFYSYLLYGKPIISITEKESYLYKEVSESKIGIPIEIGDSEKMTEEIIKLSNNSDECITLGHNASKLYSDNYTLAQAQRKYEKIVKWLIRR